MSALEPARLEALDKKGKVTDSVKVQFNPATMTLQMSNSNDGGDSRGRQTQQYNGSSSTTLSLDLEFDTADDGTSARPVDVRGRTAKVRQFVLPGAKESKQAPPRVKFRWGTFELVGVMGSLTEELSLFSSEGVPLRAKVSVQIKEQDPRFDALERGAGANPATGAPAAGEPRRDGGTGPGTSGSFADSAALALSGETAADFLARNGLAPEAWRAVGDALTTLQNGVELEAGASVEFDSELNVGGGVGITAGFEASLEASVEASLGLEGGLGPGSSLDQGFALSAAGGLTAATARASASRAEAAADSARASFGQPAGRRPAAAPGPGAPSGERRPLAAAPVSATVAPRAAAPAPPPPQADPRSTSYGQGVPLRERRSVPGTEAAGYVVVGMGAQPADTRHVVRPGRSAPWERVGTVATVGREPRAAGGCGCGGGRGAPCTDCGGPR